jgi:hypothetical protein
MVKTEVKIPAGMVTLEGSLAMPEEATTIAYTAFSPSETEKGNGKEPTGDSICGY